jgi:outer membrane immunogenic protein
MSRDSLPWRIGFGSHARHELAWWESGMCAGLSMQRFFLAGIFIVGISTAASAADMPVKAPRLVPGWSWAGLYGGINGGYSFGRDPFTQTMNIAAGMASSVATPRGGLFGGQIGYNWQFAHVVIGAEADAQWAGQSDTSCGLLCLFDNVTSEFDANVLHQKLDWFATARARLGWANDGYLLYVTGGPAWAGIRGTDTFNIDGVPPFVASFSNTRDGWAAGVGIEARLFGNWTAKLEYLHLDFGTIRNSASFPTQCGPVACAGPYTLATSSAVRDDIIRVGLNYKVFAPTAGMRETVAPVNASAWSWSGGYIGINGGYGTASDPLDQVVTFAGTPSASTYASARVAPAGGLFGGQAGFNWQTGAMVLGIEGDAEWADQRGASCGLSCSATLNPVIYITADQRLDWLASVRGRVGWANEGYLFYVTGGGAFGGVKETDSFPAIPATASFSQNRSGWTAGGGVEAHLWGNWTGKLEYLHFDLGNMTNSFAFAAGPTVLNTTSSVRDDVVRAGLNYKLGG